MADRGGIFVSLRTRNYRLWISGQMVSLIGTWMQRVAQDWLVLDLSHGNAFLLGVVMALQFGPTLLLSVWGGMLADRYDKRRMLMLTQALISRRPRASRSPSRWWGRSTCPTPSDSIRWYSTSPASSGRRSRVC
ncbi:major facilitator superfamily multidrug efflux transporter [Mycobacteroides abscessus subsp. abscessus]|nr:major facilitator superfamily multidrug efflux transporter [Mycobacteroides abscessus subsp. abscessus]